MEQLPIQLQTEIRHAMETQGVLLLLLLLLCAVSTCWGQQSNLVDKLSILSVISQLTWFTAIGDTYELC